MKSSATGVDTPSGTAQQRVLRASVEEADDD
jgi:hypothetical protein